MTRSRSLKSIRSLLLFSAAVTCLGVAFSTTEKQVFGSYVSVLGAALFIYAVHRFGRTGPDEP
jgi:hypothetical protein